MAGKKILLIWNGSKDEASVVINELHKNSHQVVYLVSNEKKDFKIPGITVHLDDHAKKAIPASGVDVSAFAPPGQSLLEQLYKIESLILTMMNRGVDNGDNPWPVDQKKRLFYELVRYWNGILDSYRPEVIFFPAMPHNVSNLVIYALAILKNINLTIFHETWITDRILICQRYDKSSSRLLRALESNKNKEFATSDLSADLRDYYDSHNKSTHDSTPFDVVYLKKQLGGYHKILLRIKAVIRSIRDLSFFKKAWYFLTRSLGSNLKKEYESVMRTPDLKKNFVYAALHLQPEMSTSPLGEMFSDQILMLETLSHTLPKDWKIYVKDHPFQWSVNGVTKYSNVRYQGYYKKIAALENIEIVPIDTDTYTLINGARAVATVTGRAAPEGVMRGKPGIIFGHAWFKDLPGIFYVNDVESCRRALTQVEQGFKIDQKEVIRYFKSLDESTLHGFLDLIWANKSSTVSREKSVDNIVNAFLDELAKI